MNRVYIVIVNWNCWRDTVECLESLRALSYPAFNVIVCDNGSTDDSLHRLRDWIDRHDLDCAEYSAAEAESGGIPGVDPWLVLVRNGGNLGFAGGNNVALRYALSRDDFAYVWLLNNDTVVEADALGALVRRMEEQPSLGMCGSTIRYYGARNRVQALGGGHYCCFIGLPWHYGRLGRGQDFDSGRAERWMNYVEGASLMASRAFLKEVGLLCEEYFLYFEEADWAERAKGRFELGFAPRSVVYHKVGRSIGTSSNPCRKSYTCDFYNVRNRILFTTRYYPYALPTVYLVLLGGAFLRIFLGRFDHAAMVLRLLLGRKQR